jgi:chromatin modification-related protein VID21
MRDSLQAYLEKNDLQRAQLFDPETLPPLEFDFEGEVEDKLVEETLEEVKQETEEAPEVTETMEDVEEQDKEATVPSEIAIVEEKPVTNETETDTKPDSSKISTDKPMRSTDTSQVNLSDSNAAVHEVPPQTLQQIQEIVEIPRASFKRQKHDEQIELFNPDNKDAVNMLILMLKIYLPAKVAEVTSLAELYYLAQTLPLVKLMPATHKAVTSAMYETALTEGKINVVHSRIEELKRQGKWSLRQPTKFVDPIRTSERTQWENLLSEMNWMAIDFKEERKWRMATCAMIAKSVADYWKYGKVCCIKTRPMRVYTPVPEDEEKDQGFPDASDVVEDSIDISKLLQRPDPLQEIRLVDLPKIDKDVYLKHLEDEPSPFRLQIDTNDIKYTDKTLLDGVPAFSSFQHFDDQFNSSPLVPISKALIPHEDGTWYNVYVGQVEDHNPVVPDQQKGLFGFSSRNRLTSAIKPPQPPSLRYLNLRTPTIWLPEDDQNLIEYVNQFSFNWGVVSAHLSKRPTRSYQSNIERRTPWQCFERYIQLNDAFQISDMRGQNYLSATKWLEHAHHIQATTKRRISPLGVGVESIQRGHKRLRWASMFEAIRKCMRKRESVTRPNSNQQRKNVDEKKLIAPTPAELSKLKFERDKAIQDAYVPNHRGRPQSQSSISVDAKAGTAPRPVPSANSQLQTRPNQRPSSVPAVNVPKPAQVIPQPSQGQIKNGPNSSPYTPEQIQQLIQMRQRKLANGQSSPSPGQAQLTNAQARSNSNPVSMVSSPVIQHQQSVAPPVSQQPMSSGKSAFVPAHVSAVINQIQAQHPNLSKQEVTRMAAQYLANLQAKQNRSNVASPVGIPIVGKSPIPGKSPNPQLQVKPVANGSGVVNNLTAEQKAQLDMLKVLHAEQQQKRQQASQGSG